MVAMAELVSKEVYEGVGRLCAYYAYLEGAVAQAIWLELRLEHDVGHPVTDRLQLRESFKLLISLHQRAGHKAVTEHLSSLHRRLETLMEKRNLLVHGTVIFDAGGFGASGSEPGIRWLIRRGANYNRKPQDVTVEMTAELIEECKALTADLQSIGRLYPTAQGAP